MFLNLGEVSFCRAHSMHHSTVLPLVAQGTCSKDSPLKYCESSSIGVGCLCGYVVVGF